MERRFDPTTGEWTTFVPTLLPPPDDSCPLCPTRPGGRPTAVPHPELDVVVVENGVHEVIVYSADHTRALVDMEPSHIARVVEVWADRYAELGERDDVGYVFIFENRGLPANHPHGQIHAYPDVPPRPRRELDVALAHLGQHGTCVFCDVVARELADGVRIVAQNRSFLAFVPFAARFPYEVHVMSHRHAASLLDLTDPERLALAQLLQRVLVGYDALYGSPLPYVMSIHQAPTDDGQHQAVSHFHMELSPMQRTATEPQYLAGAELGAGTFFNEAAPEATAARLREVVR